MPFHSKQPTITHDLNGLVDRGLRHGRLTRSATTCNDISNTMCRTLLQFVSLVEVGKMLDDTVGAVVLSNRSVFT